MNKKLNKARYSPLSDVLLKAKSRIGGRSTGQALAGERR